MENSKLYRTAITVFFIPIVVFLGLLNLISTSYVTWGEVVYFLKDNALLNLILLVLLTAVIVVLLKFEPVRALRVALDNSRKLFLIIKFGLLFVLLAVSVFYVLSTRFTPFGDALWLHEAATDYENGIYTAFENGWYNYMDLYPFQTRTLILFVGIDRLMGGYSLVGYQLLNCLMLAVGLESLSKISSYMGGGRFEELLTILTGILWIPAVLYTSFVYGNLLGLGCALLALRLWICFMNTGRSPAVVPAGIFMALAVAFKSTFLVFFVALLIYGVCSRTRFASMKKWVGIVVVSLFLVPVFLVPGKVTSEKTGEPLDQGMASISWIEMGLEETVAGPGWYTDDSKRDYAEVGWNREAHDEMSREHILLRLEEFKENPLQMLIFFERKLASQWNEPTAESFWVLRSSESGKTGGLCILADYMVYVKAVRVLDIFLMLIVFGLFLFMIFEPGKKAEALILPMIFVGLFLFHLVWEAKAQYAFFGWFLMIPVALSGYVRLADRLTFKKNREAFVGSDKNYRVLKLVLLVLTVAGIFLGSLKGIPDAVTGDNYSYAEYISENFE